MRHALLTIGMLGLFWFASPAKAEALRCSQGSAYEGDSRVSVLYKCGQPALKDTFCDPVYFPGTLHPVPSPFAQSVAPCLPVELWVYDRGQGNLIATVRFRGGVVQSISYGRQPE
ncbi:DUF2845 domain-containing protein [Limnobacter alexandrii]|jgi:hypothetical protein|uniref:DUF2845 domain-containing protein n=1 Tax=Limnobacter alexandrii TaxID=2570352 RepID=UPI0011085CC9|nr:DUF2845 domain-containing protein [Limnobacter alexandrii]